MAAVDFKKLQKELYLPGKKPELLTVPPLPFIMVEGAGDPNQPDGAYQQAVSLLYAFCYTIKMSKMSKQTPDNYFDFVVPPLEGLWWMAGGQPGVDYADKSKFRWISMIRQPDFVTPEVFAWAAQQVQEKKGLDPAPARLTTYDEGLCVQCLHLGSYDDEPATVARLEEFMASQGLVNDISESRSHHEIYLGDPRKSSPEKRKTVLRLPVRYGGGQ